MKTVEITKCYDWASGIYRVAREDGYSGDGLDGTYVLASEAAERERMLVFELKDIVNQILHSECRKTLFTKDAISLIKKIESTIALAAKEE